MKRRVVAGVLVAGVVMTVAVVAFIAGAATGAVGGLDVFSTKPTLPVAVGYRAAEFGPGVVLQLQNNSDRHLCVLLKQRNPTTGSTKEVSVDLAPKQLVELGWAEDMKWSGGDQVTVRHADYKPFVGSIP